LNVDRQLKADVGPCCVERGSVDNGFAGIVPREAVASLITATNLCPIIVRCAAGLGRWLDDEELSALPY